jgi:hypothetical protein
MFLGYLTAQVVGWSTSEVASLKQIIRAQVAPAFQGIGMGLPPKIHLVKTTGREEGAAAYTRGLDVIALPANMVASLVELPPGGDSLHPAVSTAYLAGIVTHEFFHLLSKNNPAGREELYARLGYRILGNAVALPDVPSAGGARLPDLKVTNPDAPLLNVAIDLVPVGGAAPVPMTPVLLSSQPYEGGTFFATMSWKFMEIEQDGGTWVARLHDGQPVLHDSAPLLAQYTGIVGTNFQNEIFHPDEILAQSFVVAAQYPALGLLADIRAGIWNG